jgi:hypothetical protein
MTLFREPLERPATDAASPDRVDRLLREFFAREMPDPWPARPSVPAPVAIRPPRCVRPFRQSRLALAASVLFLLAGLGAASELLTNAPAGPAGVGSPAPFGASADQRNKFDQQTVPPKGPPATDNSVPPR